MFLRILCFPPRRKDEFLFSWSDTPSKPVPCKEVIIHPNGKHAGMVMGRYLEGLWRVGSCAMYTDYDSEEYKIFNQFKDNTCGKFPTGDVTIYYDTKEDK